MQNKVVDFIYKTINLRDTTDIRKTIDSIRKSIAIRGYNVWILACAAMLASIGLDTNSEAVIIGAMLISPLMSPILGIGLSIGINDRDHLLLALENFAIAVGASLAVSAIYFFISPFAAEVPTDQILARTHPTTLDVLIATFGGIAGIVANSRKEITNAIPGVAIATALMPPICVAGYGIANMEWAIFGGALYLFFINSFFIALSTFAIVRFLNFPYIDFVDDKTKRQATRWITVFAILVIVPSAYFLWDLYKDSRFRRNLEVFIEENINNSSHRVVKYDPIHRDSVVVVDLYMTGVPVTSDSINFLDSLVRNIRPDAKLHFIQNLPAPGEDEITNRTRYEVMKDIKNLLETRDAQIDSLNAQVKSFQSDTLPVRSVSRELKILYPELTEISVAMAWETDFDKRKDTIPVIITNWSRNVRISDQRKQNLQLGAWLQERMKLDTIKVVSPR